jgi:ATP-dependent exoDNAse (exonuclease V) alpha subunit
LLIALAVTDPDEAGAVRTSGGRDAASAVGSLAACRIRHQDPNYQRQMRHRMRRQMKDDEVNRIVQSIDATRVDLFSMDHVPAPEGRAFRKRAKEDIRITRAKSRLRMAAWRKANAESKRATGDQIGKAMLQALATSKLGDLVRSDYNLVGRAFADLQRRGFDIGEAKEYLRRLRDETVPPVDRAGESAGNF